MGVTASVASRPTTRPPYKVGRQIGSTYILRQGHRAACCYYFRLKRPEDNLLVVPLYGSKGGKTSFDQVAPRSPESPTMQHVEALG